jgi:PAS domain S-box-containing protein
MSITKMTATPKRKSSVKTIKGSLADYQMLELLLNNIDDSLLLVDQKLNILCFNIRFQNIYRTFCGKEITKGVNILSCPWPDNKEKLKKAVRHVLRGASEHSELIVHLSKEISHHYRLRYSPAKDESNEIVGILISIKSADKEQSYLQWEREVCASLARCFHTKADLKTSLEQLLSEWCRQFDQRAGEVWVTDIDHKNIRLIAVHSAGKPLKTSGKHVPFHFGEGLPGKSWKTGQPVFIKNLRADSIYLRKKFAEINKLTSATAIPVQHENAVVSVLIFYSRRASDGPVVLNKNILSQLASDIQRKKSEDNLVMFFLYAPELLCITGPDGYFKKVNPAFTHLLGFEEHELLAQPFTHFVHPHDVNNTQATLRDITSGRVIYSFENRYRTKSNEWKWIAWSTSEILNQEGLVFCYGKDITEERKLRDLLDATNELTGIGSWEIDFVNTKVYWSPVTRRIHEIDADITPDFDLGLSFFKEGESKEKIKKLVNESLTTGSKWDVEVEVVTARKNTRWVRIIGESEFKDGQCIRVYGSMQDIHARKSAELEISKILAERNDILESIGDAFFTLNDTWTITYWNKQAEKLFNKTKEQSVGHSMSNVFPKIVNTPVYDEYQKTMVDKQPRHFEAFSNDLNIWYSVSIYAKSNGLSVYLKDVTDRILVDEKVRQSNERFELLTKATHDAVWEFNFQTNTLTHVGDGFGKLFGYREEERNDDAQFLLALVHPDDLPERLESQQRAIENRDQIFWEHEYRFKKKDDTYAFVYDRGYITRDHQGRALRMIGATQDITTRREYERSLEKLNADLEKYAKDLSTSNAELEQFAYVASHDLQEPLRMVSSFMGLLEKNYGDKIDDRGKQYIHFAVDGAKRMRQIILDLLEFSRVGRFAQQKEEFSLADVLDEAVSLNSNQITERMANIHIEPLPTIHSHRAPVRQVFQNLISNALKYTKPDVIPEITVRCTERAHEYCFEVADNGIGIAPAFFEKIFILFHRLYRRDEYSGTGIGLSVCKKIVETLGGKIWVESQEGKGSSFFFTLPKHS